YHWDLPQALQDVGGWQNEAIVTEFEAYADLLYRRFGDRVKRWITFNEAYVVCALGHSYGVHAPGIKEPATAPYKCAHNILKCHAKAYRLYESTFKTNQKGFVGITIDSGWYEPLDKNNPLDVAAVERTLRFKHGWYAFPIFKGDGDYPPEMREYIDRKSAEDNLTESRLPVFSQDWKILINGSADFLGFNHYTTEYVKHVVRSDRSWEGDQDTITSQDDEWPASASDWLKHVPWGFRKLLVWIKKTYNDPLVYVTENGFSDTDDVGLNDEGRVKYYREYINEMLKAVTIDGCNVKSYTAWSLMDNFEWARGY
ncbi:Lactase-like protein, partial [Pseudolycoriella hygida]